MSSLGSLIDHVAAFRRPSPLAPPAPDHKEWLHFCVLGDELDLLINFNISGDSRLTGDGGEVARLCLIVRHRGRFRGGLATPPREQVRIKQATLDARMGSSWVRFTDGRFVLHGELGEPAISVDLTLDPAAAPLLRPGTSLGRGPLHWLAVPRLIARGAVVVEGAVVAIEGWPAYHDHNWGRWRWGDDFAWQWGFAHGREGAEPTTLLFARLLDRAATRDLGHALCLWRGERLWRVFREGEVTAHPVGWLRRRRPPRFPPVMGLLVEGEASDVPAVLELAAASGRDHLRGRFVAADLAQIVLPDEVGGGVTLIHEVRGEVTATAVVRGEAVELVGPALFEWVGHA